MKLNRLTVTTVFTKQVPKTYIIMLLLAQCHKKR